MKSKYIVLAVLFFAILSCKNNPLSKKNDIIVPLTSEAAGIDGMARYLESLSKKVMVAENLYANTAVLESHLSKTEPEDLAAKARWLAEVASSYSKTGDQAKAVAHFTHFAQIIKDNPELIGSKGLNEETVNQIMSVFAIAYMRMGEIDNCLNNHNEESCIFPIRGKGVHTAAPLGADSARIILDELIRMNETAKWTNIWVYNIVHMALGDYPDGVEDEFRIPSSAFDSDTLFPRFNDVAHAAGVAINSTSGGVCTEDFDGDGYPDIITSGWELYERIKYMHNNGDGTFSDWSESSGLGKLPGGLNMIHADYNNDGHPDILVLRGAWLKNYGCIPNSLLRNNGDGTFEDVTWEAGIHGLHPTQNARWEDFDNDGWLDIFIGNESTPVSPDHPCELYRNNGDGTFEEIASRVGIDVRVYAKGSATSDYDNDGDADIFISSNNDGNRLFRNELNETGKLAFTEVTKQAGISGPVNSFPCWFFDYNNDGHEDIFIASYLAGTELHGKFYKGEDRNIEFSALYHNNGDGTFTDKAVEMGLDKPIFAMGSNFFDINNDGFLDMYFGTGFPDYRALMPNMAFLNSNGEKFLDVTTTGGFGHLQKGHAIASSDLDLDGDLDIYAVMGGAFEGDFFWNVLYENPISENNAISIELKGVKTNRSAIGTMVKLTVVYKDGSTKDIYRRMSTGGSFGSSELMVHVGLGKDPVSVSATLNWPSGEVQQFPNLPLSGRILIIEGEKEFKELNEFPSFEFSTHSGPHHI